MRVLGLDPSLTNFGWALHDPASPLGDASRCPGRGRFQTSPKMEFIDRFMLQRERLRELVRETKPDRVGIEFPIFNDMWSEGMYGLFLFCCEALKAEGCDVVFWSPGQIKNHARDLLERPKGWVMDKADMVEAAKLDAGGGRWNHNEADAYHCARMSARFWQVFEGTLSEAELTKHELHCFTEFRRYIRGKKAGKVAWRGTIHRENERFFAWSTTQATESEDAEGQEARREGGSQG